MEKKIIDGSELANMKFEVQEDGTLKRVVEGKYLPEYGKIYYFINGYGQIKCIDSNDDEYDHWLFNHQPFFRTEEECKEYRKFLDLLDEYTFEPDWNDDGQQKHYICYSHNESALEVDYYWGLQTGMYNFESEEKAREFIGKVGEQNVKRFMFDIWE